jgi:hypothetical protein
MGTHITIAEMIIVSGVTFFGTIFVITLIDHISERINFKKSK